ncbi:DUF3826 domain-containing protein [Limisphaera sp. 4302-co]
MPHLTRPSLHPSGPIWRRRAWLALLLAGASASAQSPPATDPKAGEEQAYRVAVAERCRRILAPLQLDSGALSNRVHAILMEQYQTLRHIHDRRDRALDELAGRQSSTPEERQQRRQQILDDVRKELDQAHRAFLDRLGRELPPEQVDRIKDGMTYNLVDVTYQAYLRLLPELSDEQKQHIRNLLLEARELAMDEGTAREKHMVFNRYKGRINNYLSAQGYDLKAAERRLRESISAQRRAQRSAQQH